VSVWLVAAGMAVLVGALVQGAVGYGMNLVAAPLLALIDPALVPAPLLLIASGHAGLAMFRERQDTDWHGVSWAMLGRVPGTALGVFVVATLPPRPFGVAVGLAVLGCLVLSTTSWRPRPTRGPLVVAGVAAGAMGTAASIGGPPIALLYQHSPGPRIRSTLAACFALGSLISVAGLAITGQIHPRHLVLAAFLLPFLIVGFLLSNPVRKFLDAGPIRHAVLVVAAGSSLVLIGQSVLG
jgi:uncharacterized membrane protein YfcA